MIKVRITGNPFATEEQCISLLKNLFAVLSTGQLSTTVEFEVVAPKSREVTSYRFRMTYQPKGKQQ